ncbi:ZIP family metal transporter [Ramlibacter ginsenosidimutans]|uniref:ZIP family metal transporter n=1 Tax=Ramlibacter ginsenosidimutans TaxID=502333 RepID=A0A934WMN2_9BURK|nr:ZIP family metal transporter [Ramlibacter ginsenosidimutans]MBK6006800.1 ZIP family metal transporter [Ramlibacter ginsenosidimutans]
MNLLIILLATLCAGIGSVWLAAALMRLGWQQGTGGESRGLAEQHLLSLAAGALLSTAFMHLLPEAMQSGRAAQPLFATLLVGLVFFFLLDKAELWHHGHEHHHGVEGEHQRVHDHAHGHDHSHSDSHAHADAQAPRRAGGWAVLTGDSVHCFGDGVLIASAFVANPRLGLVAAFAVLAHEVPHHIGDLAVLRQSSASRRAALVKVSLAGAVTPLGGLTGWWIIDRLAGYLPFFLVVASSSFIYVALADLIPQLQKRLGARETLAQIAWLLLGIALVIVVSTLAHE